MISLRLPLSPISILCSSAWCVEFMSNPPKGKCFVESRGSSSKWIVVLWLKLVYSPSLWNQNTGADCEIRPVVEMSPIGLLYPATVESHQ